MSTALIATKFGKWFAVTLAIAVMLFIVTFPLMKMAGRLEKRIRQKGFV